MRSRGHAVSCLLALVFVAGCASTQVSDQEILVTERIPRPKRILVYNVAATPADAAQLAGRSAVGSTTQTPEEIQAGRQLGVSTAVRSSDAPEPKPIVMRWVALPSCTEST